MSTAAGIPHTFFTRSAVMRELATRIEEAAGTDAPLLIEGEPGAGKSFMAFLLHAQSARGGTPLVRFNCAALPGELLEGDLFGYERKAFPGATRGKPGKFALAHEGTLLLEEIGVLPAPVQDRLLRLLQDGTCVPLGSTRAIHVDVRLIASAQRPLGHAVSAGLFRADLYARLAALRLEVPPLRERAEEIPILAEHFLHVYAKRYNRPACRLAPATLALFAAYRWPGNVHELQTVAKRIVVLGEEAQVRAELRKAMEYGGVGERARTLRGGREDERLPRQFGNGTLKQSLREGR
jgi:Nif-specific regulatory protein